MANNVPFQSSVPATPSSATIVETIDQGGGVQRQRVSIGDILAGTAVAISSGTVTPSSVLSITPSSNVNVAITGIPTVALSSNPTVIPSSAFQVTLTSNTVNVSSGTVTLSSNPTVILSSNPTVILSSNPTITSVSSGAVSIISGANTANVVAGSSAVTSTMSALVVALSTLGPISATISSGTVTLSSNPTVIPSSAFAVSSGTVTLSSNPTVILSSNPTTIPSSIISVMGDVANAATDSGNPLKVGGIYNSTNPTSVTSGQRVQAWFDKSGKQIVNSALRALKGVQLTALSSSTTETNITPSSTGGNFIDIYGLILANFSSANPQQVTIKDSSGGTSRMIFEVPAQDTRGFMLPVDAAVVQAGTSQAWTATLSNSSGGFQVTALYVTNV